MQRLLTPNPAIKPRFLLRTPLGLALSVLLFAFSQSTHAGSYVWDGGGTDGLWTNPDNWTAAGSPSTSGVGSITDIFTFASSVQNTSYLQGDVGTTSTDGRYLNQLIFDAGADDPIAIRLRISSTNAGGRQLNFRTNGATAPSITVQSGSTGAIAIGDSTDAGSVYLNSNLTITHNGSGTLTIPRPVNSIDSASSNSNASLTKNGGGELILSATNNYTGGTILNQGKISLSTAGTLGATTGALQVNNNNTGAGTAVELTLATGANTTVGSLSGSIATPFGGTNTANITTASTRTFTVNQTANGTYTGTISGAGNFALGASSNSALTLTGDNSYSGTTTITAGTLEIAGTGDINQTSSITVASGATFKYNSSTALTKAVTNNGGTISGTGKIGVSVALDSTGDILAPGNSPGIQEYTTGQSWASFTYQWEIDDFNGTVGSDADQIQVTGGALALSGSTANSYILDVTSLLGLAPGDVPNFSETTKSWDIITATGGITGFNNDYWSIDVSAFTTDLASPEFGGSWSLSLADTLGTDSIVLTYTAIPEPRDALLGGIGILLLLRRRRGV